MPQTNVHLEPLNLVDKTLTILGNLKYEGIYSRFAHQVVGGGQRAFFLGVATNSAYTALARPTTPSLHLFLEAEERLNERRFGVKSQVGGRVVAQPGKHATERGRSAVRAIVDSPVYDGWVALLKGRKRWRSGA
jgi:hypothetical protein